MAKTDHTKYLQRYEATRTLTHCWWELKWLNKFGKQFGSFFKKLNMHL